MYEFTDAAQPSVNFHMNKEELYFRYRAMLSEKLRTVLKNSSRCSVSALPLPNSAVAGRLKRTAKVVELAAHVAITILRNEDGWE